jgi:hypothetical protein
VQAHAVITACPPDIGGWSDDGESFIIKNVEVFARDVIPTAYKHNHWSSFVRQLNFYGFRKIKSELLTSACEFRHPQFIRGQSQLLSLIKRAVPTGKSSNL